MDVQIMAALSCPVCEDTDVEVQGAYRGHHSTFKGLRRAHCRNCGMGFAAPMPSDGAIDEYNASYFESAHGGQPQDPLTSAFFSGLARLRMAHVERYLLKYDIHVSRLMELGPGPGFFARSWLRKYPATGYLAIETDASCHALLKAAGVRLIDASAISEADEKVDFIVMSHVLEHVPDPVKFLVNATRNLRQGGAIFIEVPCQDWKHKPIDEPHLLFFDKNPMNLLLGKLGFSDIEVSYHGQEIERLRSGSATRAKWLALRSRLISMGLVAPFAIARPGMEALVDPLERALVFPYRAHLESSRPAWWLRAVAHKTS